MNLTIIANDWHWISRHNNQRPASQLEKLLLGSRNRSLVRHLHSHAQENLTFVFVDFVFIKNKVVKYSLPDCSRNYLMFCSNSNYNQERAWRQIQTLNKKLCKNHVYRIAWIPSDYEQWPIFTCLDQSKWEVYKWFPVNE